MIRSSTPTRGAASTCRDRAVCRAGPGLGGGCLLHAGGRDRRTVFQTFQPRDFRALFRPDPLQFRYLAQQRDHQSLQLDVRNGIEICGRRHPLDQSGIPASGEAKNPRRHGFCPCYKMSVVRLIF
jgi:hypothetical protein